MRSSRFGKDIIVTNHARARMAERSVNEAQLLDIIETGELRRIDRQHLFVFKRLQDRRDNLVCVAAAEERRLIVKTVMVNWLLEESS